MLRNIPLVILSLFPCSAIAQTTGSACCLPSGSCTLTTRPACALSGGTWLESQTACLATTCDGACCSQEGACSVGNRAPCTAAGSVFRGVGSVCDAATCNGACCLSDGGCADSLSAVLCQSAAGEYRGPGSACANQVCGGACCDDDGACGISNTTACVAPEVFHGLGSACVDVDCAGACCTADGECIETSQNACEVENGVFLGPDAVCADAVCTGACCLPDKACIETGQGFCVQVLGSFQGRGSLCGDDCPTVMPTAFTYQGQLQRDGRPLSGLIDGRFSLWLSPESQDPANQVDFTTRDSIEVENGLFTLELDFRLGAFNGNARWLQVELRHHNDDDPEVFTTLSPRQSLTPAPYALQTRGIVVLDNGNVGIGTKAAQSPLHVAATGFNDAGLQPGVHFARDGAGNAKIELVNLLGTPYIDFTNDGVSDFDARLRLTANDSLAIEGANVGIGTTNPANRLSVASGNADFLGNVGIGTTTPQARLDVRGDIRLGPSGLFRATSGEENLRIVRGWVGGSGVILGGSGFAVTQLSKGDYLITFNTPFASTPSVTATVDDETDSLVIIDFYVAGIFAPNASSVRVRVRQHSDAQGICNCVDNQRFQFIAIGPR